jgi:hypothetical protein
MRTVVVVLSCTMCDSWSVLYAIYRDWCELSFVPLTCIPCWNNDNFSRFMAWTVKPYTVMYEIIHIAVIERGAWGHCVWKPTPPNLIKKLRHLIKRFSALSGLISTVRLIVSLFFFLLLIYPRGKLNRIEGIISEINYKSPLIVSTFWETPDRLRCKDTNSWTLFLRLRCQAMQSLPCKRALVWCSWIIVQTVVLPSPWAT